MSAALLALFLAAAPDAPLAMVSVDGDVKVELVVGKDRGVEVQGDGVEVQGPAGGKLTVSARARAEGPRPTVQVRVDARTLTLTVQRGAQVRARGERLDALSLEVGHTSKADTAALMATTLTVRASQAARVRARGELVTVTADRSAQVVLVGKPKKLTQDVRDAARVVVEP